MGMGWIGWGMGMDKYGCHVGRMRFRAVGGVGVGVGVTWEGWDSRVVGVGVCGLVVKEGRGWGWIGWD